MKRPAAVLMRESAPAWACECAVDVGVPVSFAWQHMSDVRNWSDPPAEFGLDGLFASGSIGWTRMTPDQPARTWRLVDVQPERSYTVVGGSDLEGWELRAQWRFEALTAHSARLTQRLELIGEHAGRYVEDFRAAFEPNLEPGMRRIRALIEGAAPPRA